MTTNYHTPLSGADLPLALISWNTRFSDLDSAISNLANSSTDGITVTLGESVSIRQAGFIDPADGYGYLLDADSTTPRAGVIRGFWTATESSGPNTLQVSGVLAGFSGLTAGEPVYVDTTAGSITQTRPSPTSGGSQIAIMQMGIALSSTQILIRPAPIQYQKRDAMAQDDTLTITHHDDDRGYLRKVLTYITETVAGTAAQEYASSNQDVDVGLRDREVSTYGTDQCTGGTPSASGTTLGAAANGFNDNLANYWGTAVTGSDWLEYLFGASKTIRKYVVKIFNTGIITAAPRDWQLQYYDGATWQTADTVTSQTGWSNGETRTFYVDTNYTSTRWRLYITANNGYSAVSIGDVDMMEATAYTDGADKLAQTFALSGSTPIETVGLWLKKVGTPTGTATVRIETTSGGNPTGTLAHASASITFSESSLSTSYAEKVLTFASGFTLGAGTYAIVLSTDRAASESNYVLWGADGSSPSYSGGDMRSEISSTWSAESKDAVFGVYQPGTTHPSQVDVDWWSSSYADMVNRYGDGSGSNLDSQTTFKCLRSAGFSDVTVVVEIP